MTEQNKGDSDDAFIVESMTETVHRLVSRNGATWPTVADTVAWRLDMIRAALERIMRRREGRDADAIPREWRAKF